MSSENKKLLELISTKLHGIIYERLTGNIKEYLKVPPYLDELKEVIMMYRVKHPFILKGHENSAHTLIEAWSLKLFKNYKQIDKYEVKYENTIFRKIKLARDYTGEYYYNIHGNHGWEYLVFCGHEEDKYKNYGYFTYVPRGGFIAYLDPFMRVLNYLQI